VWHHLFSLIFSPFSLLDYICISRCRRGPCRHRTLLNFELPHAQGVCQTHGDWLPFSRRNFSSRSSLSCSLSLYDSHEDFETGQSDLYSLLNTASLFQDHTHHEAS
jgi:hypothetical protein